MREELMDISLTDNICVCACECVYFIAKGFIVLNGETLKAFLLKSGKRSYIKH